MTIKAEALSVLPPSTLFNLIKKKFSKTAKFPVVRAIIGVDYFTEKFSIEMFGVYEKLKRNGPLSEYSEIAEILKSKVAGKIKALKIGNFSLDLNLDKKSSVTNINFLNLEGNEEQKEINTLF